MRLIEDVLKEHNCGCCIHICGRDRLQLLVYGKEDDDMNDIFTIHTNLKNIRIDLIARLGGCNVGYRKKYIHGVNLNEII